MYFFFIYLPSIIIRNAYHIHEPENRKNEKVWISDANLSFGLVVFCECSAFLMFQKRRRGSGRPGGQRRPQGRPSKVSGFVRAIHECLSAASPLSTAQTGYTPSLCYAVRLIGFFLESDREQKDTTRNRNSPDALTSVNFFKPRHAAIVCFCWMLCFRHDFIHYAACTNT